MSDEPELDLQDPSPSMEPTPRDTNHPNQDILPMSSSSKSPRSRRKQTAVAAGKTTATKFAAESAPQLPIEVWSLVCQFSTSFKDILSLCGSCKYIYTQMDPWQKKAAELIAQLTNNKNESYRRALRASTASGEPFSGLVDLPVSLMDQFTSWRDEYCILYACKSPKVLVHRFEGWERPERISSGTTVASFLDWLLAIDRTLCVEDMKIVQRVFALAPTLIGTEELTAAIAQKFLFEVRFGSAQESVQGIARLAQNLFAVLQSIRPTLRIFSQKALQPLLIICDVFLSKSAKTSILGDQIVDLLNASLESPPLAPILALKPDETLLNYSSILNWKPKDVARAITLLEAELFLRLKPHELYGGHWMKRRRHSPGLSPNVKYMINRFNAFSSWIASSVLSCSQLSKRAERLAYFIKTCKHLVKMRNFNGALQVCAGFSTAVVARLKITQSQMSSGVLATHDSVSALLSADLNFNEIRGIMAECMKQKEPYIPYLGMVLNDSLSVIDTDMMDPTADRQTGLWFCLNKVASIQTHGVEPLKYVQDSMPSLLDDLKPRVDSALLSYLQYLPGYADEELFAASLVLEPRRTGMSSSKLQVASPIPDQYNTPAPKFDVL
eukprot:TRINITY_DN8440_c0_g1_i1.p1 TRINITY_DN8440_c0_g1~~TRINITY_DN8440_c0_g1_i1.p1  ORF type:complete len:620 (+),score=110.82 TRINITY_DN8440_c0_g1_i1:26-1861(+)